MKRTRHTRIHAGTLGEHQSVLVKTSYFAMAQNLEAGKQTLLWMLAQSAHLSDPTGNLFLK